MIENAATTKEHVRALLLGSASSLEKSRRDGRLRVVQMVPVSRRKNFDTSICDLRIYNIWLFADRDSPTGIS